MIKRLARTILGLAAVAALVVFSGCAQPNLDCNVGAKPKCDPRFGHCAGDIDPCRHIPPGATSALLEIDSSPSSAKIFVDGTYVGRTPLKHYLWFFSTTRAIIVVAEPIYPGQARQEQRLTVPHLPKRLTFFMNNPAKAGPTGESGQ